MNTTMDMSRAVAEAGSTWSAGNLSALIARLGERAAYATGEEYAEIRALMTALKALLSSDA